MSISYLLHGIFIGAAIAIPVGPIAFLCMQYAFTKGFRIAFSAGVGAALADTCFGICAGLGLSVITEWVIINRCWIQLIGSAFLCFIGLELLFTKTHRAPLIDSNLSYFGALASTFTLTLANPLTILAFMALFGYFELNEVPHNPKYASLTITGIFTGSLAWWTLLTYGAALLKDKLTEKKMILFREIGGIFLLICGIYAFVDCLIKF